jgi:CheY-like chemotaxis protein
MDTTNKAEQRKLRVLVVDDFEPTCKMVSKILKINGFEAFIATSGAEALEFIQSNPVSIILLDIMMPEMDGLEVCRRIKGDDHTSGIKVILFTAFSDPSLITEGQLVGADGFIQKPFEVDEFVRYLEQV